MSRLDTIDLRVLPASSENMWILACLLFFLVLPIVFAVWYFRLYKKEKANFYFPRDAVYEKRHREQFVDLSSRISSLAQLAEVIGSATEQLLSDPSRLSHGRSHSRIALADGRCCVLTTEEDVNPHNESQVFVSTRLAVLDSAGQELVACWLDRTGCGLPKEPIALCAEFESYLREWRQQGSRLEKKLHEVRGGEVRWLFSDFLYFSLLTQITLGCNDILPNSAIVRRVVMLQLVLASVILIFLLNIWL